MSYIKTTWETGDTITAEKLNNMESGIESGNSNVLYVTITSADETYASDKTFAEIKTAYDAGKVIIVIDHVNYYSPAVGVIEEEDGLYSLIASGTTYATIPSPSIIVYIVEMDEGGVSYYTGSCAITDANQ